MTVVARKVENPQWQAKDTDTLAKIELLLLERISLAGIARVMGVSSLLAPKLCEPPVRCRRTEGHSHPETSWKTHRQNG